MVNLFFIALLFLSFCFISPVFAQTASTGSDLYISAVQNVVSVYTGTLKENTHLYNGVEYIEAHPGVSGSPFWGPASLQPGSIYYDGIFYPNILLAYDAVKEEIVIRNHQQLGIKLLTEKIDYFTLSDQFFIHIKNDRQGVKPGFYNIIYEGEITLIAKRGKMALRVLLPADHYEFAVTGTYFIKKGDKYYPVDDRNSLLNSLKDKRKELKDFLRKNKLDFKRGFENTLIKTAAYYSDLKK